MVNPQLPEDFASLYGMGAPKEYYPVKWLARWGNVIGFFILSFLALAVFGLGIIQSNDFTLYLCGALFLFAFALGCAWGAYNSWKKYAVVYENGFAYLDRKGMNAWNWKDVNSFLAAVIRHYHNGIYTGTTHTYTLFNLKGEKLVLNDALKNVEKLAGSVEAATFPILYQRAADQYNGGAALTFGPVTISKGGMAIGKKTYPWNEVKQVSINRGVLQISKKDGGWFSGASASAMTIPNLRVLLTMIDQIIGVKAG